MTDQEKMDVILGNEDMRVAAGKILDAGFVFEVMPFMNECRKFVNAKTDAARGEAFAAIFENHLKKDAPHEINLPGNQMSELRAFGSSPGPIPADSPLVDMLGKAAVQVKITMAGALNVRSTDPQYENTRKLLDWAAQPPAPTGSGRVSASGRLKGFLTRTFTHSSPKKESPPSSSGSSSSSSGGSSSSSSSISSSTSQAKDAHRASAVRSSGVSSTSGPRSIASANFDDYINMDAVLASPEATRDLRAYLRRGFENMPGVNTENLDFLESYAGFAVAADPAEKKKMLTELIDKFVQQGSPSEINLMVGGLRKRVVEASRAWIAQGDAAMPQALVDDLATARRQIATLLQDKGNALDLLRKELFPQGDPTAI